MKHLSVLLLFIFSPFLILVYAGKPHVRGIILDTDWWTDVDDAVAVRILAKYVHQGQIQLKGVVIDAVGPHSVVSMNRYLLHEDLKGIPIGVDRNASTTNGKPSYHTLCISNTAPGEYRSNDEAEDCVVFYRHLLSAVPKGEKIDIITIGYTTALSRLLDSRADTISPLDGIALVKAKVRRIWTMAGTYPKGKENNFICTVSCRKAGANFCKKCPVPICFLGFEVGESVLAGGDLPEKDLLHQILYAHGGEKEAKEGRSAWDPMTVLLACTGNPRKAGFSVTRGTNRVDPISGRNVFTASNAGSHTYVIKRKNDAWYEKRLNKLLR